MAGRKKSNPRKGTNPASRKPESADQPEEVIETAEVPDTDESAKAAPEPVEATQEPIEDVAVETVEPDRGARAAESPYVTSPAPVEQSVPAPVEKIVEVRRGFVPALIGGILAAVLGFLAARADILDPYLPQAFRSSNNDAAIAALQSLDTQHATALATLRSEFEALEIPDQAPLLAHLDQLQASFAPLKADIDATNAALTDLGAKIGPLDARLSEVEKRPMTAGVSKAAIAAYEREMAALQQAMADQRADVESLANDARATEAQAREIEKQARELEENALSAAHLAAIRTNVAQLRAALDDGSPLAPILGKLTTAGVSIPDGLSGVADKGVATLALLSKTFTPDARNALSSARSADDSSGGLGAFLQSQLGARSVVPRDGDDPDAVLSRADAALTAGHLSQALDEIATLPDAARGEMNEWSALANTRLAALKAVDALAQSLNTN